MTYPRVKGYCPACGGTSLIVGDGGHITCTRLECAEPAAADDILNDPETRHIVDIHAAARDLARHATRMADELDRAVTAYDRRNTGGAQ